MDITDFDDLVLVEATIYSRTAMDGYGKPTFGSGTNVSCHVIRTYREIRDATGAKLTSSAQAIILGGPTFGPQDKMVLTADGSTFLVQMVETHEDEAGLVYTKAYFV